MIRLPRSALVDPSFIDYSAKPDVVAPGVGIESLADPSSLMFATHPDGPAVGHDRHRDAAVSEPDRNEHGRSGRQPARSR